MSSEATASTPERPRRPYQIIVLVDRDTLREVNRRRGAGTRRLSKSEAAYRLLTAAIAAENVVPTPSSDGERRDGEPDRRKAS